MGPVLDNPRLRRTYESSCNCEIWEAFYAALGDPEFFERFFGNRDFSERRRRDYPARLYIDEGLTLKNPIRQVLDESWAIF
jgi:hypothetical protein